MDETLIKIESCVFAVSVLHTSIFEEMTDENVVRYLNIYVKNMIELIVNSSNLHQLPMNATLLHLLSQFCTLLNKYAFYIENNLQLLQTCVQYCINIPCAYHPILANECSIAFYGLIDKSQELWLVNIDQFESLMQYVLKNVGQGQVFYQSLSSEHLQLLQDITV